MTDLEDRLTTRRASVRTLALTTFAAVLLVAAGFVVFSDDSSDRTAVGTVGEPLAADGPSTWAVLPDAPIGRRAYPVSTWTGTEAWFWAGSSLDRRFAYAEAPPTTLPPTLGGRFPYQAGATLDS